jgi:prevent-host-death family protein
MVILEESMPEAVSVVDAKRQFSDLLRRASEGERIIVTSHGRPVAQIGPPDAPGRQERRAAIQRIQQLREQNRLSGLTWKELRDENRR